MRCDPGPDLCPVRVQEQQAALATALDQLIWLGHKLRGQEPGMGLLQVVEQGLDMLVEDRLVRVQHCSVNADVSQARCWLDKLGSSGRDAGGRDGCAQEPVCQQQLSIILTNSFGRHGEGREREEDGEKEEEDKGDERGRRRAGKGLSFCIRFWTQSTRLISVPVPGADCGDKHARVHLERSPGVNSPRLSAWGHWNRIE